ncbi:26S proteasome regulatory subunit Rpn14p [Trichomonascus vanleenenianus]|uniref:26S proteasome regulatory subunit Rpn14p n=1 Tax=Trichomonascus vanleenenianus TaxID=2268995 RepID=UPI003EC997FA
MMNEGWITMTKGIRLLEVQPSAIEVIKQVQRGETPEIGETNSFWIDKVAAVQVLKDSQSATGIRLHSFDDSNVKLEYVPPNKLHYVNEGLDTTIAFPKRPFAILESTVTRDLRDDQSKRNITSVDVSPNGELIVLGDDAGRIIVLGEDQDVVLDFEGHLLHTLHTKFYPSSRVILSAGLDMQIKIWDALNGTLGQTLTGHKGRITGVLPIGRGRNTLSSALDGTVQLWETGSGRSIHTFKSDEPVLGIAIVSGEDTAGEENVNEYEIGNKCALAVTGTSFYVWQLKTKELKVKVEHNLANVSTAVASDLDRVDGATRFAVGTETGSVFVYDTADLTTPLELSTGSEVQSISLRGSKLVICTKYTSPVVYDFESQAVSYLGGLSIPATASTISASGEVVVGSKFGILREY